MKRKKRRRRKLRKRKLLKEEPLILLELVHISLSTALYIRKRECVILLKDQLEATSQTGMTYKTFITISRTHNKSALLLTVATKITIKSLRKLT